MCNEKTKKVTKETEQDYRFLDYRLQQLENNLLRGQEKLEQEQKQNYQELIKMLQILQEGNNKQNEQLVELSQKTQALEAKYTCVDKLKEAATKNTTRLNDIERRLEIYKQILFVVGTGVVISLLGQIIHIRI